MARRKAPAAPPAPSLGGAAEWRLLGQGGANAVFAYCGGREELRHRVLRVPKPPPAPPPSTVAALDAAVWADVPAVAEALTDLAARDAAFAAAVFAPAIGAEYVPPAVVVSLPPPLAAGLAAAAGAPLAPRGALLADATAPLPDAPGAPTLTIEIKPKCGWPHGGGRRARALLQRQARRGAAGAARRRGLPPPPDPLDLFSGEWARVARAVEAHLTGEGGGATWFVDGARAAPAAAARASPAAVALGGVDGVRDALTAVLVRDPLLARLKEAQAGRECPDSAAATAAAAAVAAGGAGAAHAARALRSYLSAITARDVSVMVTLASAGRDARGQPVDHQGDSVGAGRVALGGGCVRDTPVVCYRATVVDVGVKSAAKLPAHAAEDARLPRSLPQRGGVKRERASG